MGDQMVAGIHDIGISARADLDLGDNLHDSRKANLRSGHLEGVLATRHGKRDVRLGLVLEVDRAPVHPAGPRLDELGRPGEILLASDDIRVHARDTKLLFAGEVEMAQLDDGGDVAKDPEKVQLALLRQRRSQAFSKFEPCCSHLASVRIVGRGPGRLAYLLFDLLQELRDPGSRGHRLRAFDPDDRGLSLSVGKVELDQARRHQHATNQNEKDDDVLAEEPAARGRIRHRRKVSARSRIFRGTVRPRSSAVLRFTASSILSAPWTGKFPGRAPRRISATSAAAWTPCA